ncbi:hypothetical protein OH76DRAFT_1110776 [Lentinus brumalis]|uniref:Uncharacterized protein n=1 Tax=Lentinus brumalis TaxID=2498619 RepID=A0A371CV90_9APHY|nr:hypothetical protein OH76DRAFT_1110776 [Polyporus brumalis]
MANPRSPAHGSRPPALVSPPGLIRKTLYPLISADWTTTAVRICEGLRASRLLPRISRAPDRTSRTSAHPPSAQKSMRRDRLLRHYRRDEAPLFRGRYCTRRDTAPAPCSETASRSQVVQTRIGSRSLFAARKLRKLWSKSDGGLEKRLEDLFLITLKHSVQPYRSPLTRSLVSRFRHLPSVPAVAISWSSSRMCATNITQTMGDDEEEVTSKRETDPMAERRRRRPSEEAESLLRLRAWSKSERV